MDNNTKIVIKVIIYILSLIIVNQTLLNIGVNYIVEND